MNGDGVLPPSESGGEGETEEHVSTVEDIPPDELPHDGVFLSGALNIICALCNDVLEAEVANLEISTGQDDQGEVQDFDVPCPKCTATLGRPVVIPVMILVGRQVEDDDEEAEDAGGLPPP